MHQTIITSIILLVYYIVLMLLIIFQIYKTAVCSKLLSTAWLVITVTK